MKKLIIILFLLPLFCKAQYLASIVMHGYNPVNSFDTVRIVLMITECDDCPSKSYSCYARRQKYEYIGDRMPPGDYSDQWRIQSYLDKNKKPLPKNIIVWDAK